MFWRSGFGRRPEGGEGIFSICLRANVACSWFLILTTTALTDVFFFVFLFGLNSDFETIYEFDTH